MDECAFCDRDELGPPRTSVPTIKKITDGGSICDRNDLGRPMVAPTNEIETFAFVYRAKIKMSLFTIKKKHAVGCLSACFYIAIEIKLENGILL